MKKKKRRKEFSEGKRKEEGSCVPLPVKTIRIDDGVVAGRMKGWTIARKFCIRQHSLVWSRVNLFLYYMFAFIYLFTLCESIYKTPDQTVYTHTYTVARLVSCKIRRNFSLSFPGRINENKIFLYDGWICICRSFIYRGPTLLSLPLAHRFRN